MFTQKIETECLILRQWKIETDLELFFVLNSDPEVMKYFPHPLTRTESDVLAFRIFKLIEQQGWGFWADKSPLQMHVLYKILSPQ
ncbi:GNAT family N-acetyltransferase [Acinetobacter guerrae]|uniref:GNAT family N-acetyltransferase n=1 Tax=Acinetobacter guerrae TaxID=1843371 RepID=UPI0021CC4EAA|nr:GNAT family N-acetyltransferase [Acinetobacter guerrae]